MRWAGCWAVVAALVSCASQPAPEFWRIDVGGHAIGVEERIPTATGWTSAREYTMRLDGVHRTMVAESEWVVVDGRVTEWRSADRAYVAHDRDGWAWGAAVPLGEQSVFDPASAAVVQGVVSVSDGRRWFTSDSVRWWVNPDGSAMGADAVSMHRVSARPTVRDAIDPAQVFSLSVFGTPPQNRGWTRAELVVSGPARAVVQGDAEGRVVVNRPLWLELPAGPTLSPTGERDDAAVERWVTRFSGYSLRDAVSGLARQIPTELQYTPLPSTDGSARLHGLQGNCTDHARLLVSVLKRFGQDAQVRVGWRYRDQAWVPHAWARVRFPSVGWVDVDPTAGERIASPLYLAFSEEFQQYPWEALGRSSGSSVATLQLR